MSQDIEAQLEAMTPRGPDPDLRGRVLNAVGEELRKSSTPLRARIGPGLTVAAALLASVALNIVVHHQLDRRMAALLGPTPLPRAAVELAADIARVTDPPTGEWAARRIRNVLNDRSTDNHLHSRRLQQWIRQLMVDLEGGSHDTIEARPQMGGDLHGGLDRAGTAGQRLVRLEHRNRA